MLLKVKHHIINFLPALGSRNYRIYFLGFSISMIGTWFAAIAEQWLVYPTLSDNKALVSIVYMANLMPTALLVLFSGVVIDRIDKRRITIIFQLLYSLIAFSLFILIITHHIQIWHVLVGTFLTGVIFAFESTARMALMIDLVEKKDIPSALSLNGAIFNSARAIGPALAGIIIATLGIPLAYLLNGFSFLAVVWSLVTIKFEPHEAPKNQESFKDEFNKGWHYILKEKEVLILMTTVFFFSFFLFPTATLMPVFAHDIFNKGEIGFGLLQSFIGIGAMTAGLLFAKMFEIIEDKYQVFILAMVSACLSGIIFAFSSSFILSLVMGLISGFCGSYVIGASNTTIQLHLPPELRGRIISFYTFCMLGGMGFGSILVSIMVNPLGARMTYFINMILFAISLSTILLLKGKIVRHKMNELSQREI